MTWEAQGFHISLSAHVPHLHPALGHGNTGDAASAFTVVRVHSGATGLQQSIPGLAVLELGKHKGCRKDSKGTLGEEGAWAALLGLELVTTDPNWRFILERLVLTLVQ